MLPLDLTTDTAPQEITQSLRERVARRLFEQRWGELEAAGFENVGELMAEMGQDKEFLAMVEAETIVETARLHGIAEQSIEQQADAAAGSGLYRYHPDRYDSVEAMLDAALQDTRYGSGPWYNLRTLQRLLRPYLVQRGADLPAALLQPESRSKARYLADDFNMVAKRAGYSPQTGIPEGVTVGGSRYDDRLQAMLRDAVDPAVTPDAFRKRYPHVPPSGIPDIEAYTYAMPEAIVVVMALTQSQMAALSEVLRGKVEWKLGTGQETFVGKLQNKK